MSDEKAANAVDFYFDHAVLNTAKHKLFCFSPCESLTITVPNNININDQSIILGFMIFI